MSQFQPALAHVLKLEGGFIDHASDPGGATNMGITRKTLEAWRGESVTVMDVRELSRDESGSIYRTRYWDAIHGDQLPAGVALFVFDAAVNHGPKQAARFLQRAAGAKDDGWIGPATLEAVGRADPHELLIEMGAQRMVFYAGLPTFDTFGLGWSRRLMDTVAAALEAIK